MNSYFALAVVAALAASSAAPLFGQKDEPAVKPGTEKQAPKKEAVEKKPTKEGVVKKEGAKKEGVVKKEGTAKKESTVKIKGDKVIDKLQPNRQPQFGAELFKKLDRDGDGQLSLNEFVNYQKQLQAPVDKKNPKQAGLKKIAPAHEGAVKKPVKKAAPQGKGKQPEKKPAEKKPSEK